VIWLALNLFVMNEMTCTVYISWSLWFMELANVVEQVWFLYHVWMKWFVLCVGVLT